MLRTSFPDALGTVPVPFLSPFSTPWFHSIFVLHFRLSAVREGGCSRQVEKEAGEEHPGERSSGL